jgi:DNA polymerase III subunit epsilon
MGYIPADTQVCEPDDLKSLLTTYKENLFIRNLVNSYAAKYPARVISFDTSLVNTR